MPKFIFIYRYPVGVYQATSPEKMQEVMQQWLRWIAAGQAAGWMLDAGNEFDHAGVVVAADGKSADGPFAECGETLGGYSIVQAENLAAAAQRAKECPGLFAGGRVEVRPLFDGEYEG
ncbi:YciI family protein [Anatilimnocola floriformis]|uniref:YciI family protein n=1 Tax=Anatilimnocola floriformis TaxID=2948575 RepID=UPI0020C45856|nr:YciI family protein [Anatilimnocola floriformis]